MDDCIFCRIASGAVPVELLHDDGEIVAFRDADPQAPTHALVVPRSHLSSAADLTADHDRLWAGILHVAQTLAKREAVDKTGYRLVINVGAQGGQTVPHLHLHLLGGRAMNWPPG